MNPVPVVLLLLAGLLASGCGQPDATAPAEGTPERIITLAPSLAEMVFAVGAGERLVGTVEYSDYPAAAKAVPRVGDSFRVDYERLGALQPDVVLVWGSGNPPEIVQRIRDLGYRVEVFEPTNLDSIAEQMLLLGNVIGAQEGAAGAAASFRDSLSALRGLSHSRELSVFWQISADPWFTVTGEHVISEIIAMCGGRNIFAALPGLAPAVTLEAVLAERPEVIIASVVPGDDAWKADWQKWAELPAVKNDDLYAVNPDLVSRSGPRIVEGAARVCAALSAARD